MSKYTVPHSTSQAGSAKSRNGMEPIGARVDFFKLLAFHFKPLFT